MVLNRLMLALCTSMIFGMPLTAAAQTVETTPVPVQKPNLSPMQFLVGTWSCRTTSSRRPAPYISTATYAISTDGWWIEQTTAQNPVPWFNHKTTTYDKITYDPTTNRWIDVSYGDLGAYGLATSSGWNGNTIVWHDPTFAPNADVKSQSDVTTTKDGDNKMTSTSTFTEAGGRTISVVASCTKNG